MTTIEHFKEPFCSERIETNRGQIQESGKCAVNWANIKDKLIRLVAKYTDNYAADIVYDIESVQIYLDECGGRRPKNMSWLFGFRENGVDGFDYIKCHFDNQDFHSYRSIWRLDAIVEEPPCDSIRLVLYKVNYEPDIGGVL